MKIIYGPPGTGKTTTLIDIVRQEVLCGVPIDKIAYVSFSKKAAVEAQQRLSSTLGFSVRQAPHFRTIHSLAFRAVRARATQMMDVSKFVDFGKKSGFSLKGYYNPEEGLSSKDDDFIMLEQLYRNNRKYSERALDLVDHTRFVTFMRLYSQYKRTFNYLDYTDLLDLYIENNCEEDVRVAIIDEAQDLTTLQWNVVLRAFRNAERLYVAGDDDQCIYQWSGADVEVFLNLRGETTVLEHSHRLPSSIQKKAKEISSLIQKRVDKVYHGKEEKGKVRVIDTLEELTLSPKESVYLLARNNFLLERYMQFCIDREIPFLLKGQSFVSEDDAARVEAGNEDGMDELKVDYIKRVYRKDQPVNVNISTIHGVKGGEADHVVVLSDVSRGVTRQLNIDEDSEHRVFYVAVTRARNKLTIVAPESRTYYPYLV